MNRGSIDISALLYQFSYYLQATILTSQHQDSGAIISPGSIYICSPLNQLTDYLQVARWLAHIKEV